jgi:hypothetical protein
MSLNKFSDFMQVLNSIRKHPTKSEKKSKHVLFSSIFLLLAQKLNHRNYSKQKLNMKNFKQAKEYDMNTYAKIQGLNLHNLL